jgi:hypothetical protein
LGNEAYIVGIVPVVRPTYSHQKKNRKGTGGKGPACGIHCFETEQGVHPEKILNHEHEIEDGDISLTEETQYGTDRMGVADDRLSEKSQ